MSRCKLEFGDIVEYQGIEYHVIETVVFNRRMCDNDFKIREELVPSLVLVPVLLDFELISREPKIVTINSEVVFKRTSNMKITEV